MVCVPFWRFNVIIIFSSIAEVSAVDAMSKTGLRGRCNFRQPRQRLVVNIGCQFMRILEVGHGWVLMRKTL